MKVESKREVQYSGKVRAVWTTWTSKPNMKEPEAIYIKKSKASLPYKENSARVVIVLPNP